MVRRMLLFPFTLIYGSVVLIRDLLFESAVFRSVSFEVPVIVVGNLSAGGTGKSPMISYLAGHLRSRTRTVILSRGYGRSSKGVVFASDSDGSAAMIGDEPAMYRSALNDVEVVCSGDRREGIKQIISRSADTGVILMDDGYQHRWVKPGLKILLTSYHKPYYKDMLLPSGNLREFRSGSRRADIIMVTKCPDHISEAEKRSIRERIAPKEGQQLFFSGLGYGALTNGGTGEVLTTEVLSGAHLLMVTGIADPVPMEEHLRSLAADITAISFPDHHRFSAQDIRRIVSEFENIGSEHKFMVTTEKDLVRLKEARITDHISEIYHLPVSPIIAEEEKFLELIHEFTRTDT